MSARKNSPATSERINTLLLDSVMSHASDAIVFADPSNQIIAWSSAAESLFEYAPADVIGKPLSIIISGEFSLLANVSKQRISLTGRNSRGSSIPLSIAFDQIKDDDTLVAYCYFVKRKSETATHEETMNERNRAMQSFTYSVSHDLRAPLRRIINYAQILEEDHAASLSDEVSRLVSRMSKNAEKMSELMDALLSYARIEQQPLEKTEVNVEALVNSIIGDLHHDGESPKATFIVKNMESCEADLALLRTTFGQLLSNAVKFTRLRDNAVIEIGYASNARTHNYYVRDNGVGFDMQYAYKLFNIFQRLHNPADFEGTGIGLAIVNQIIARHGGKVWAEAKVNEGAVFWIALPK